MALMVSDLSGRIHAAPLCDNQFCFRVEAGREGAAAAAGESGGG